MSPRGIGSSSWTSRADSSGCDQVCLIIDANRLSLVFGTPPGPAFRPLRDWLYGPTGRCVLGGKLKTEWNAVGDARKAADELYRAGKLHLADDARVAEETSWAEGSGRMRSDDPHVIGLGRVTGARVLTTAEHGLIADWKDATLIQRPKGKVYVDGRSAGVLGHSAGCPWPKRGKKGRNR